MKKLVFALAVASMLGCKTQQQPIVVPTEVRALDTLVIQPEVETEMVIENPVFDFTQKPYRASETRVFDLLHTKLRVSFDWAKETVFGEATLRLRPYFKPSNLLVLDGKKFDISRIEMADGSELKFDYDGAKIKIHLPKTYTRQDEVEIKISYAATPSVSGGSAAISADKGLYFINPRRETPNKPMQIWTQGETESNSKWFPTIDKPNERCSQEIYVTVDDRFTTLSNGLLLSSTKNDDGTRTDYWKQEKQHAPYLFMLAIGEFAVVEDKWEDLQLQYIVEPDYKDDAKEIFAHTDEMLTFFSDKLGVRYPWDKYSQVVVRDYVSGAMENTSAVIFGDFVQNHKRELIDNNNDLIVAHELFHHWFGDLVTCESWSNLTMNEGFANYSEYLWLEHNDGVDAADDHLLGEWQGYKAGHNGFHPLIDFHYDSREDMFDAHSYNKGGSVLHMLRQYVGEDAFWASLNLYLTDNAYTAVEAHNLRLAFEEVTGEDLNWFFNQWYFGTGHPTLDIDKNYDATSNQLTLNIAQMQDPTEMVPVFTLPVKVDIYLSKDNVIRKEILINERSQQFVFDDIASSPVLVDFDVDKALLGNINFELSTEEYAFQYKNLNKFLARFNAVKALAPMESEAAANEVIRLALNDKFWGIRQYALNTLNPESLTDADIAMIRTMAVADEHSRVRTDALLLLGDIEDNQAADIASTVLQKEQAYPVIGAALEVIALADAEKAVELVKPLEGETNPNIIAAVANVYAASGDIAHLPFFESKLDEVEGEAAINMFPQYLELAMNDEAKGAVALKKMHDKAIDLEGTHPWTRLAAAKAVFDAFMMSSAGDNTTKQEELKNILLDIKGKETNPYLQQFYSQMF